MKQYPIVVLHGWGLSAERFAPLVYELQKKKCTVFAPTFPGFDAATIPDRPLTLSDYREFLRAYLTSHHIKDPVFIGHSFGGRVALSFADAYPGEVHALILTGTPGFTPVSKRKIVLFIAIAKIGKLFFTLPFLHSFEEKIRRWYYYVVGARDFYRAQGTMRETFKNIVKEDLSKFMSRIRMPTLLLWGSEDIIVPISVAGKMNAIIQGSTLRIVPGRDHGFPYKSPVEFVKAVLPWLRSI